MTNQEAAVNLANNLLATDLEVLATQMAGSPTSMLKEMNGISNVWGNPNIYNPGGVGNWIYAGVPYGNRGKRYVTSQYDPTQWHPSTKVNYPIYLDYNEVSDMARNLGYRCFSMFKWNVDYSLAVKTNARASIGVTQLNILKDIISQVRKNLDTMAPNLWDGNNVCKLSCQTNCQVGCQSSCQKCVTSQCHNQNCGAS